MPTDQFTCPKDMTYGPCGGVASDGACEVSVHRCTFLDAPLVRWPGVAVTARPARPDAEVSAPRPGAGPGTRPAPAPETQPGRVAAPFDLLALAAHRPVVVSALPSRALDAESITESAEIMRGTVDAVLAGDSGRSRVQFPPAYRAHLIQAAGLPAWVGVNCRDRNRVALEGELAALAHVGVAGVHAVTGDHTLTGDRPDARAVFDLESTEVVALARELGITVSVAESPASPPVALRAARLAQKVRAGAQLCFPQYCGDADDVRRFIDDARAAGADVPFVPGVPVVIDRAGALMLASFAAAVLPTGYVEAILAARDPYQAGIAAAIDYAEQLLEIDGVVGVLPAGGPTPGTETAFAHALASIGKALGAGGGAGETSGRRTS